MARKFTFTTQVYDKKMDFPATGDVDVIYIDASKNTAYRYDDSYYKISSAEVNVWGALGSVSKGGGGGGSTAWGSITGTLSSQTDLQTALDAKQDTLVSGTSIKTINGSSVLGSGDLTISGGGAVGIHALIKPLSGGIISQALTASTSNTGGTSNRMWLFPFIPANSFTISSLSLWVTTATAGSLFRVLIYSDNNGSPDAKLFESANIDGSTTGQKTITTTFTFNAGTTYWLCYHAGAITTVCVGISATGLYCFRTQVAGTSAALATCYYLNVVLGSAPANISLIQAQTTNTAIPNINMHI
jgi:hypothetical protein